MGEFALRPRSGAILFHFDEPSACTPREIVGRLFADDTGMTRMTHALWISLTAIGCAGNTMSDNGGTGADAGTGGDAGTGSPRPGFTRGVSTLAGTSTPGYIDGGRDRNLFRNPVNVAYGTDGKLYVADFDNGKIRVVDPAGTTTTLVTPNSFARPFGLAFDPGGMLYVSTDNDPNNVHSLTSGTIWKINPRSGAVAVIASGIGRPRGLTVLHDGRLAVADNLHHVIELVEPVTGHVSLLAGTWDASGFANATGAAARFATPYGLVQRADGKLVVCDYDNHRLRLVGLDGSVSTLAGTGNAGFTDGVMASARFNQPQAIAIASSGELYVADHGNFVVRRITATTIETIAGDRTSGYLDADDRLASKLHGLEGIAVTPDGSMVYVADGTRGDEAPFNRVRQVDMVP
jgi:DNA-binding beta-propeller fold protein YncE